MPLFCRHNRLTANCPICSRELEEELRAKAPGRPARHGRTRTASAARGSARPRGVVTRRLARAADDGYRNPLVPGLRATADAERLAAAIAAAAARLAPPGPFPEVAAEPDLEEATWLAFLLTAGVRPLESGPLKGSDPARGEWPSWASGEVPDKHARTATAYRAWAERAGSQAAAFRGEPEWTPQRRFARVFERLALPGFARAARFELLVGLGAAGRYELAAGELQLAAGEDATTEAAKRLLVSGDRLLLERRARELADTCAVPLAALDRAFAVWGAPGDHPDLAAEAPAPVRAALSLS
jgi:hypothetical protein